MIIIFIFHIESIFAAENGVCSAYKFISMLRNKEEMMCKFIFWMNMRNVLYEKIC